MRCGMLSGRRIWHGAHACANDARRVKCRIVMNKPNWRGIFAIPMTPWTDSDIVDEDVLRAEIDFICESASGILVPVLVSEFQALSEAERKTMMRIPVEQAKGRVPVIVNVAAVNTPVAVDYAQYAREIGADGVIAMPPYAIRPDFEVTHRYFKAISDAARMPVWIQNAGLSPLSTDQVVRLCEEIEHVNWVKEEVAPTPRSIGALCDRKSPSVHGVMGGVGGLYLPTEHDRGCCGCMVACEICDVLQHVWEMLDAGQRGQAGNLFDRVQNVIVIEAMLGMAFAKEFMKRRGIFKNSRMRMQGASVLGPADMREIDRIWERVHDDLVWGK
jgi:4-hydroxy-tetrahydrodipicolinate synthase